MTIAEEKQAQRTAARAARKALRGGNASHRLPGLG